MSKNGRTIVRFATVGLVLSPVFFVFDKTDFFTNSWVGMWMFWASLVICPGFFGLVILQAGSESPVTNPSLAWFVIGLVNCLYFATIGVVYVDMRKPRRSAAKT